MFRLRTFFLATTPYAAILFSEHYYDKRYNNRYHMICLPSRLRTGHCTGVGHHDQNRVSRESTLFTYPWISHFRSNPEAAM